MQTKERDAVPWLPGSGCASPLMEEPHPRILDSLPVRVLVLTAHGRNDVEFQIETLAPASAPLATAS